MQIGGEVAALIDAAASIGVLRGTIKNGKLNLNVGIDVAQVQAPLPMSGAGNSTALVAARTWSASVRRAALRVVLPISVGLVSGQSLGGDLPVTISDDNVFDAFAPTVAVPSLPELRKLLGFDDLTPKALHGLFRTMQVRVVGRGLSAIDSNARAPICRRRCARASTRRTRFVCRLSTRRSRRF